MLHSHVHQVDDFKSDLLEAVIDIVAALAHQEALVLLVVEGNKWRLVRADGAAQADVDAMSRLTTNDRRALDQGLPVVIGRGPAALAIPAIAQGRLAGALLVRPVPGLARLPRVYVPTLTVLLGRGLDQFAGREVVPPGDYDVMPDEAAERERLMAHLVASEWNVSHVARALRVTRMTVYNRLRRLKIERMRVRKSRQRVGLGGKA